MPKKIRKARSLANAAREDLLRSHGAALELLKAALWVLGLGVGALGFRALGLQVWVSALGFRALGFKV